MGEFDVAELGVVVVPEGVVEVCQHWLGEDGEGGRQVVHVEIND